MASSTLRKLKPYKERQFFCEAIVWDNPEAVAALYDRILGKKITHDADAVEWMSMWRELDAILDSEYSIRYIEMTCDTESPEKSSAYSYFSEKLTPVLLEKSQAMNAMMLKNPLLSLRAKAEAPEFFRRVETDFAIFRQENLPLGVEIERLSQEYQKISGAMTAEWNGSQVTLTTLGREAESSDRAVREKAYRVEWERRLKDKARLDEIFDEMYDLRVRTAKNAGFANYRDYIFRSRHRFDYGAEDCLRFHAAIKKHFVPLTTKLLGARQQKLGLGTLRPWDMTVDITGEKSLSPFRDTAELTARVDQVFAKFDSELSGFYREMTKNGLFDLANRKGKAPGGYQTQLAEERLPFIFMNAVGVHRDVMTLLHESGHAFHSLLSRELDNLQSRAPMEFCEVASMSMELMASGHLAEIFGEDVAAQLVRQALLMIPSLLLRIAMIDSFQHWIYTDPRGRDAKARQEKWSEIGREYFPGLDRSGLEEFEGIGWHKVLHVFQFPFYYVEYGVAELGALQFWQKYLDDPKDALADYKRALRAGGTLGLKDLFRRANLAWPMEDAAVKPLAKMLDEKLSVYV